MPILCWFCKIWGGEKGKLQEKAGTLSKAAGFSTVYLIISIEFSTICCSVFLYVPKKKQMLWIWSNKKQS